eukprot:CAMPEP_0197603446 /NCGR_PEP_ID=MMETSP1326-20131121/39265_1 /TAXON_ID=1155430 /ORGANISM="Genus nov. species nov., Strain RCC2288" /LENGTH=40 /DNA_ID= /DNA_START= /DNA_END= /DNA_ORIENTATION=
MSGGPYGGASSLSTFIRMGAVVVGIGLGAVKGTYYGVFKK